MGVATGFSVRGFVLLGEWIDRRPGDCPCSFVQSRPERQPTGAGDELVYLASSETTSLKAILSDA